MTIETQLRDAFREVADGTPVPYRLDAILTASGGPHRRRAVLAGAIAVAAAVVVALVVSLILRDDRAVVVRAGPPSHAPIATFPDGPRVTLGAVRAGRLAFVSSSRAYVVDGKRRTARQLTRVGDASGFAWSADGEWLAFSVRDAPGYEDSTTWITRADGSGARPLEGMDDRYSWSPTGHRLAIAGACCGSGGGGVYVVDPGHDPRPIVPGGTQIATVVWSPDGATIGYSSSPVVTGSGQAVWSARTVPAAGGRSTRITDGQLARFGPDGKALLVVDGSTVRLVDPTTGTARDLATSTGADARYPDVWSGFGPNGTVAVVADGARAPGGSIVVCPADPPDPRRFGLAWVCSAVVDTGTSAAVGPSFDPDGTQLAYVAGGELRTLDLGTHTVRTFDDLGRDLLQGAGDGVHITRGTAPNVPVWLADGSILYRRGPTLAVFDPTTGISVVLVTPVGFAVHPGSDQGLPGETPVGEWNLATATR